MNRKAHVALNDLQGHSLIASFFKKRFLAQLCSSWQDINYWHSASRGPSAIAREHCCRHTICLTLLSVLFIILSYDWLWILLASLRCTFWITLLIHPWTLDAVMAALRSRCGHYIFAVISFYLFYSSPNLSGRKLNVYHTSTHGVALVRI